MTTSSQAVGHITKTLLTFATVLLLHRGERGKTRTFTSVITIKALHSVPLYSDSRPLNFMSYMFAYLFLVAIIIVWSELVSTQWKCSQLSYSWVCEWLHAIEFGKPKGWACDAAESHCGEYIRMQRRTVGSC